MRQRVGKRSKRDKVELVIHDSDGAVQGTASFHHAIADMVRNEPQA
ncbi:hypothetical protein K2O51_08060 [Cupriavidus pinatubonensis]|nr:hypothetical protein [Cupriavidus pinatubonensis]QYY27872.1 hypothetical protein K2O51_08060 [Cupriavidus pinatubonensis]